MFAEERCHSWSKGQLFLPQRPHQGFQWGRSSKSNWLWRLWLVFPRTMDSVGNQQIFVLFWTPYHIFHFSLWTKLVQLWLNFRHAVLLLPLWGSRLMEATSTSLQHFCDQCVRTSRTFTFWIPMQWYYHIIFVIFVTSVTSILNQGEEKPPWQVRYLRQSTIHTRLYQILA